MNKRCSRCGSTERLIKHSKNRDGSIQYYYCAKCNAERMRKYRATVRGKSLLKKLVKKYEINNPEKRKAWSKALYLPKQLPCGICGKTPTVKHHNDYSKPLEVIYLCAYHHKQIHLQSQ